jgi:hypothetical protein
MPEAKRSAFGQVDQQAILANLDLVNEDPVESNFFAADPVVDDTHTDGPPGLADESPAARKEFVLYGPAGIGATR